jgi:hypothetical protein
MLWVVLTHLPEQSAFAADPFNKGFGHCSSMTRVRSLIELLALAIKRDKI